jgi:hypothetical protein
MAMIRRPGTVCAGPSVSAKYVDARNMPYAPTQKPGTINERVRCYTA